MSKKAYRYRVYPTSEQARNLTCTFGCCRVVYNWALKLRTTSYFQHGIRLSHSDLSAALTTLKREEGTNWLKEVSSVPLQQALRHLDQALTNFFEKRNAYPTYKKKHGRQSATFAASAFTWDGTSLTLAKQASSLPIVWSRPLPAGCKPSSVTVTKDKAGRYFVSILVEEEIATLSMTEKTIGIDLGLKSVLITSDGETVANPKYYARDEKKLAKAQRKLSLLPLEYKAAWYGRSVVKINRWYPSSKTCSACQHVLSELSLDIRSWACPSCGTCHDRDINAAINIRRAGLAQIDCGRDVRRGRVKAPHAVLDEAVSSL